MQTAASIEIDRPIAEVFEFTIDHVAEWSITVVADEPIDIKPEGVGSTFRCITEDRGRRMDFQGVVTRHDPPNLSACQLTGSSFDIEAEYRFEDLSGSTRVTVESNVTPKGFLKVVFFLTGWATKGLGCKAQLNELESLKRILESRETDSSDRRPRSRCCHDLIVTGSVAAPFDGQAHLARTTT